jgi:hypothetical protein
MSDARYPITAPVEEWELPSRTIPDRIRDIRREQRHQEEAEEGLSVKPKKGTEEP